MNLDDLMVGRHRTDELYRVQSGNQQIPHQVRTLGDAYNLSTSYSHVPFFGGLSAQNYS